MLAPSVVSCILKVVMKTTTFHRNLNATNGRRWSYKPDGRAIQATTLHAVNVTIKQPSGKNFANCLAGGKRAVFAWFKCSHVDVDGFEQIPSNAKRVRFNPKAGDEFFHVDGERVDFLREVFCTSDGECFAIV